MYTVTESNLLRRINRQLRAENKMIRKTRGEKLMAEVGGYYEVDLRTEKLLATHVDLETWGREIGVVSLGEKVTDAMSESVGCGEKEMKENERAESSIVKVGVRELVNGPVERKPVQGKTIRVRYTQQAHQDEFRDVYIDVPEDATDEEITALGEQAIENVAWYDGEWKRLYESDLINRSPGMKDSTC